ncbi:MIP/aquaporin family protein [Methanolobus sp. ZRKC3]|uniref:MIP/aquaporin family protein n=1 Tax=Methanolobus sp. ZRKC3 TaxID=3125786 RepID=UPI00324BFA67
MNESMRKYLAEFVSTFALVFVATGAVATDNMSNGSLGLIGIAVASGLIVMAMVYATKHISGAHINPAVTIAMFMTRKIGAIDSVSYIIAQISGAIIASLMVLTIFPGAVADVNLGATSLASEIDIRAGIMVEATLTFMLVFTIFGSAIDKRAPKGFAGFAIGVAVLLAILVGGPITGASMNPARSFGPALAAGYWANQAVYWIGPIIGGTIAALLYENVFAEKMPTENKA